MKPNLMYNNYRSPVQIKLATKRAIDGQPMNNNRQCKEQRKYAKLLIVLQKIKEITLV